jgi:YidC/Oxa1 family membrane protein insertase
VDNQRNFILFIVLSVLMLVGWEFFSSWYFPAPKEPAPVASSAASGQPAADALAGSAEASPSPVPASAKRNPQDRDGGLEDPALIALENKDLATDLAAPGRVKIAGSRIAGSINPIGARIDDLTLTGYRETLAKDSPPVRLFSPYGTPAQYFAEFGWTLDGKLVPEDAIWQASDGPLAPGHPVTLTWDNGQGQEFSVKFSVDDHYMITAEQTVANHSTAPVVARPFAFLNRTSTTASPDQYNVHSGPIGAFDGSVNFGNDYKDVEGSGSVTPEGKVDWIGFTDIYWLASLIPGEGAKPDSDFRSLGNKFFRADLIYQPVTVPAGMTATRTTKLFAGAKESQVLDAYQEAGIPNFSLAIDWGWFRWFEQPIHWLLSKLFGLVGNFGLAIMLLTVIVRGAMFPIAQKQFASMAAMRAIQPKQKAIQERYKDDKVKLQQEMAELFKREKVNPLTGCLPLFLQIPVFFALYKVLRLAIEMRHQPFVWWIKDLSAPDPAHFANLFGLLHFTPPSILALGPLALLLGITMFVQFRLNPAQMDPVQQQMFMIMPWVMMFVMAPFAAGLLIYWCTSNVLTIGQQAYLYSKHPQLKAQAEKDKADQERAKAREKGG